MKYLEYIINLKRHYDVVDIFEEASVLPAGYRLATGSDCDLVRVAGDRIELVYNPRNPTEKYK